MHDLLRARCLTYPLVTVWVLCSCGSRPMSSSPSSDAWFIESWDDPILTVKWDGNTYKAKCGQRLEMDPVSKAEGRWPSCYLAVRLVGHRIPPGLNAFHRFPNPNRSAPREAPDGKFLEIAFCDQSLCFESHDEKDSNAHWTQEVYHIISVTHDRNSN